MADKNTKNDRAYLDAVVELLAVSREDAGPEGLTVKFREGLKKAVDKELLGIRKEIREERLAAPARLRACVEKARAESGDASSRAEEYLGAELNPVGAAAFYRKARGVSAADRSSMDEDILLLQGLEKLYGEEGAP